MKPLVKTLIATLVFFLTFLLVSFLFEHTINWKLIIIGTILNLDFNIILNWISNKSDKSK